jgi:hypothetical protein
MAVCALQSIPNQGAHTREDLFSTVLAAIGPSPHAPGAK